ncbi:DUF1800 domain-containing protein [Paracoccus ravus]|uniref:DUF1800 domain-containing protein n=1 Tax=Paracoccus ravus TaxID=2447760 RepID=UPI00106E36F5|nr:DUF1800 domain-containing protein [Paracoccus ravus]
MNIPYPEMAAIRLGFGLSPLSPPPQTVDEVLAGLSSVGPGADAVSTEMAREQALKWDALRKARRDTEDGREIYRKYDRGLGQLQVRDLQRRLARAVDAHSGFGERLVQFWTDHFTVNPMNGSGKNPLVMAFVDEAIRPHVNGRFEDMFAAADTHPMMLIYLNQTQSRGPNSAAARRRKDKGLGLNENLAREALELHSMGVGAPYTQDDVRELAELLTGLSYSPKDGFAYRPQIAEPGAETVLGRSYGGKSGSFEDIRAAFRDIARRPETARYMARKLAVHFVSDNPSDEMVGALAGAWQDSNGDLPQVYRVLAEHPELAACFRHKVRQPFDLLAAGLRALGMTGAQVMDLNFKNLAQTCFDPMIRMGQRWWRPNGPDGWPEAPEAWLAPQLLAARISWSMTMPRRMLERVPDPREFLGTALGGTGSEALAWAVPKAESQAEGVGLVLASTDFNRR